MLGLLSLDPDAVFDDGSLCQALGLTLATLARARREGRLRYTRKGKRVLYLGQWVKEWINSEVAPQGVDHAG
jgi:hypothetical protein